MWEINLWKVGKENEKITVECSRSSRNLEYQLEGGGTKTQVTFPQVRVQVTLDKQIALKVFSNL